MVKHVILWQLKDELSDTEKAAVKAGIKEGLEGLAGQIPGLVEIHVNIDALPSSNADLMLDTTFESAEALKGYSPTRPMLPWPTARCAPTIKTASASITRFNVDKAAFFAYYNKKKEFLCPFCHNTCKSAAKQGVTTEV